MRRSIIKRVGSKFCTEKWMRTLQSRVLECSFCISTYFKEINGEPQKNPTNIMRQSARYDRLFLMLTDVYTPFFVVLLLLEDRKNKNKINGFGRAMQNYHSISIPTLIYLVKETTSINHLRHFHLMVSMKEDWEVWRSPPWTVDEVPAWQIHRSKLLPLHHPNSFSFHRYPSSEVIYRGIPTSRVQSDCTVEVLQRNRVDNRARQIEDELAQGSNSKPRTITLLWVEWSTFLQHVPAIRYRHIYTQRNIYKITQSMHSPFNIDPSMVLIKKCRRVLPQRWFQNRQATRMVGQVWTNIIDFSMKNHPPIVFLIVFRHFRTRDISSHRCSSALGQIVGALEQTIPVGQPKPLLNAFLSTGTRICFLGESSAFWGRHGTVVHMTAFS